MPCLGHERLFTTHSIATHACGGLFCSILELSPEILAKVLASGRPEWHLLRSSLRKLAQVYDIQGDDPNYLTYVWEWLEILKKRASETGCEGLTGYISKLMLKKPEKRGLPEAKSRGEPSFRPGGYHGC